MARLKIHVTPGAGDEAIVGWRGEALRLKVRAAAEKGRANAAAARLLAVRLCLPPSRVAIVRGHTSRDKLVEVDGLTDAELRSRLNDTGGGS
jgi:uncharacterized protein YggU (UPF0235/DUF167 family)